MRNIPLSILAAVAMASCVVYPTQRTYFEPNGQYGTPTPSTSCGYHNARNDALVRDVTRLHVQVSPHLMEGKPLSVTVLFRGSSVADVSPEKYELRSLPSGLAFRPISHKINTYMPDRSHPYYSRWLHLEFSAVPEELNEIAVVFLSGSVSLNGQVVDLAPFRFSKTTKNDIYYASINC
jgi:hypothetical protein